MGNKSNYVILHKVYILYAKLNHFTIFPNYTQYYIHIYNKRKILKRNGERYKYFFLRILLLIINNKVDFVLADI